MFQGDRIRAAAADRPQRPRVAAHALARDVPLITHNLSEPRRTPHLLVETWMTA